MLRDFINRKPSTRIESEIEEELRFHRDMLTQEYQAQGLTELAAKTAASRRLGDVEGIQKECVAISRRSRPAVKLLKLIPAILFASGLLLRVSGVDMHIHHLGDVMMLTAVLGHVFLRLDRRKASSTTTEGNLVLPRLEALTAIESFDQLGRSPVERFLTDKTRAGS